MSNCDALLLSAVVTALDVGLAWALHLATVPWAIALMVVAIWNANLILIRLFYMSKMAP